MQACNRLGDGTVREQRRRPEANEGGQLDGFEELQITCQSAARMRGSNVSRQPWFARILLTVPRISAEREALWTMSRKLVGQGTKDV